MSLIGRKSKQRCFAERLALSRAAGGMRVGEPARAEGAKGRRVRSARPYAVGSNFVASVHGRSGWTLAQHALLNARCTVSARRLSTNPR